ncbi:unnamed protein product [Trifolium pratense]|uniref:Uncharacterized protein n=1 Tax=Trifolium pratense TaxID=57577 RepID=A0ACB0LD69_TRIPR|nr:unnamed protein product [Trifolium pratense]
MYSKRCNNKTQVPMYATKLHMMLSSFSCYLGEEISISNFVTSRTNNNGSNRSSRRCGKNLKVVTRFELGLMPIFSTRLEEDL